MPKPGKENPGPALLAGLIVGLAPKIEPLELPIGVAPPKSEVDVPLKLPKMDCLFSDCDGGLAGADDDSADVLSSLESCFSVCGRDLSAGLVNENLIFSLELNGVFGPDTGAVAGVCGTTNQQ